MTQTKNPNHGAAVADENPSGGPMDVPVAQVQSSDDIMQRHFIVFFRDAGWQFTYRGSVTGPFASREVAIAEAIREAKETGVEDVEVIVQDSDLRQETVWRVQADGSEA